jgi:GT2 family glycosyltransferase
MPLQTNNQGDQGRGQRQLLGSSLSPQPATNTLNKPLPISRKILRWGYQKMPLPIATKRSIWTRLMLAKGHLNGASRMTIPRAEDIPSLTIEEQLAIIDSLKFPLATAEPEISIVIPCYNQIHYTLSCLTSIRDNPPSVDYEVIIINDASTTDDYHLLDEIDGLTVIHNRTNSGYLESCNNGISSAKGRYLCLLNNDVNVLPSSFDSLYKTFKHFPTAGLVGSKLTYPTGQLQEAGGIVWNDGSAWNVGRLRDANEPQFNYLRSVDYCSAASIMVRRDLLNKLGGFDKIYKPAYYEDTDLAFGVRSLGFDVLYQPCSVVVHYEGISHGTNLSQGLKKNQLINAQTFYEKWQSQLVSHRPNGKDPDQEKDRGFQLRVLLVDKCTPSPDRDAGSVVLLNLMLLLRHLGYQPTFIPDDNYANLIPYTPLCQSLGIECIYAPYVTSVKQHLEQFGNRYDLVILFRPDLSQCHMPVVRRLCPNAKIIYYPHDLHYIRIEREAKLYGKRSLRAHALASKKIELDLSLQADSTIVVSVTEKEELTNQLPNAQIDYLPLIVNESSQGSRANYGGSDLVFVGNFNHSPNEDAVCWFAKDILPLIVKERPDTVFHVVGANPPSSVYKLTGPNLTVHGFVEDLDSLLSKMTLSVAPLRFGAGMKGKIVSAMRAGLPVVCTSIGSEGMQLDDRDHAYIADDAAGFADGVLQVLKSRILWEQLSQSGLDICAQRWGKTASIQGLQKILSQLGLPCSPKHQPESLVLYPFD